MIILNSSHVEHVEILAQQLNVICDITLASSVSL